MSDELLLPQVPEPKPEDPEDVSWALSTAEAMWARGDHSEGVKWVRRAAEAAADAEDDARSLELAKAAADLASMLTKRQSRASIHIDDDELVADEPPPPPKPPTAKPAPPKPAPKPVGAPASITKQVSTPSRPPAPLPSKTSQPPPAMGKGKPLGTNTPKSIPPPKMTAKSEKRKSKANLENEARAAFAAPDTSPDPISDTSEAPVIEQPVMRRSRPELGSNDPTFVGSVADVIKKKAESQADDGAWEGEDKSAAEWDASPTQNLTGDELGFPIPNMPDARKTSVQLAPDFKATVAAMPKPNTKSAATSTASSRAVEPHDPGITTTQAVRVVVWRDGNGVHVAPAGTVVSAITVDAVLVALDANADLTAWLTQKGR
ncbi:MAG: hypothetical protein KIT84_28270 [Labilithrix sp.]|nr:hypothetical protein [Labilithrix sp.]MCW5814955.1 hypothetical protein [Labilithrix sp.]